MNNDIINLVAPLVRLQSTALWDNPVHQQHTQKHKISTVFCMQTVWVEYTSFCHFPQDLPRSSVWCVWDTLNVFICDAAAARELEATGRQQNYKS